MQSLAVTTVAQPKPPQAERNHRISGKVRVAVDAMVWNGLNRQEAANIAGLKDNSLYVALSKPDVKSYYLAQCEVLRTSGRARRIHRLESIAEQDENKQAAVNAIRALDYVDDQQIAAATRATAPGLVVVIEGNAHIHQQEAKPPIEHDAARAEDDER